MNKCLKVLSLLAVLSISSLSLAYEWNFLNFTGKTFVIKLKLEGAGDNFFNIAGAGQKTRFDWTRPNPRHGFCLDYLAIGEYDEAIAANFPGTNSPKLPSAAVGGPVLDTPAITKAIDARGPWFDSLSKIAKVTDPKIYLLDSDQFNILKDKYESVRMKLVGSDFQQDRSAMRMKPGKAGSVSLLSLGIDLDQMLQTNATLDNVISGSALPAFMAKAMFKCSSRDFIIVEYNEELALITTR